MQLYPHLDFNGDCVSGKDFMRLPAALDLRHKLDLSICPRRLAPL
jgi:hypothetical protein